MYGRNVCKECTDITERGPIEIFLLSLETAAPPFDLSFGVFISKTLRNLPGWLCTIVLIQLEILKHLITRQNLVILVVAKRFLNVTSFVLERCHAGVVQLPRQQGHDAIYHVRLLLSVFCCLITGNSCWFVAHVVLGSEAKVVLQNLTGSHAKKTRKKVLSRNMKVYEVKEEHSDCPSHTSMHPSELNKPTSIIKSISKLNKRVHSENNENREKINI